MADSDPDCPVFAYSTTPSITPTSGSDYARRRSLESDQMRSHGDNSLCDNDRPRRNSTFFEVELGGDDAIVDAVSKRDSRPRLQVRFRSKVDIFEPEISDGFDFPRPSQVSREEMPLFFPTLPRLLFLALVIILVVPSLHTSPFLQVDANPTELRKTPFENVRTVQRSKRGLLPSSVKRADTQTVVCKRWAQQSALINGTLYLYGGRSTTSADQTSGTWNNDFLTLDLTKSWQISSPSLTGLPIPSGPPAVSLGYLWNSYNTLYLYGGEFSDTPVTSPVPFSTWSYNVLSSSWSESSNPQTSSGKNSEPADQPVQRAAEGAGVSVPNLGRGFYFGGHLDGYTTPGWSQSIARVYLRGLLEYTFPGYSNAAVNGGSAAGASGIYRNITEGGTQESDGFPERADGILVYIPGYGKSGIILGLAGGTNATFTQMNVIDVYDIDSATWYKQATAGPTPEIRVNPCAVAVSAADGSSTQVYMYGGQNLIPYGEQTQYDDMWILTVPSFTWIKVDTSNQATPPARAGHTCNVWNAQMIVVGGYVGEQLSCESPGVYVFNTSSLSWQNGYLALEADDNLNRQKSQQSDPSALQGSYGYAVPKEVQSAIGGNAVGAATITAPAQSATQGPLATGSPRTYTVTQSSGQIATETASPSAQPGDGGQSGGSSSSTKVGAIVAGVIAGLLALLAAYLGFCVWLYRKQLKIYKSYSSMAQTQALNGGSRPNETGFVVERKYEKSQSSESRNSTDARSGNGSNRSATEGRANNLLSNNPYRNVPGGMGLATAASSTEDLMAGHEPSFLGVVLNPRRSLRVVNRD